MGDTRYVHKINQAELCALLRIDDRGLRKLAKRGLPEPVSAPAGADDEDGPWWPIPEIRTWITATGHLPARELLLSWRPDATSPADLLDAHLLHNRAHEPVAAVQHWDTDSGSIAVAWPLD
jgi:hypothetical protein